MAAKLYSQEIERSCLSSMFNFSDKVIDFIPHITEEHFYFQPHRVLFLTVKNLIMAGSHVDSIIVAEKLKSIGVSRVEDIDIIDYISILQKLDSVNSDSIGQYFQILQKYYHARQLTQTAIKINEFVSKNISKSSQELICGAEKIFGEKVNSFASENEPLDLFAGLMEEVENRGNEPREDGVIPPYNNYKRLYGNFLKGSLSIFASGAKIGKSTLLLDIMRKTCDGKKLRGLYLDTELTYEQQRLRLVSAMSGVPEFYIRYGKFRLDKEMLQKVRNIWPLAQSLLNSIDHVYIGGKDFSEVISLIRRWFYKNIHDGMSGLVILDYLKLANEKMDDAHKEYQVIYDKANKLKELAQELQIPIVGAIQTNGDGDIAMSKRVRWIVDLMAIFRKKTPEEIALYGDKFGSHSLCVTESRFQGEDTMGFADLVKFPDGKYQRMFLNFNINNFNVEDRGNAVDVAEFMKTVVDLDEEEKEPEEKPVGRQYRLNKTPF